MADDDDSGTVRPVLVAFVRVPFTASPAVRERLEADVAEFADREGYEMGEIFTAIEGLTDLPRFAGVLASVELLDARAIVMAWPEEDAADVAEHQPWVNALRVRSAVPVFTLPRGAVG